MRRFLLMLAGLLMLSACKCKDQCTPIPLQADNRCPAYYCAQMSKDPTMEYHYECIPEGCQAGRCLKQVRVINID
jgi:hypothetical protein